MLARQRIVVREAVWVKRSTERILVTHTGSLPRPARVAEAFSSPGDVGDVELAGLVQEAVRAVVRRQIEAGVDVLNDGEMSKEGYSTYVRRRLTGFDGQAQGVIELADMADFPGFLESWSARFGQDVGAVLRPPACNGDITVSDPGAVQTDIDNLRAGLDGVEAEDVFISAASPGVIAAFFANHHYPDRESYLVAIADAMRPEYEAITDAGFVLQLDCPDLAMCRHLQFSALSTEEFRDEARRDVEILNYATANIDPDHMRMHLCWGNYEGPHHKDIPLADIIDIVLAARPNGLVFEAANPRHAHELAVFEDVKLPEGKVLMPGVVDSTINYIEHPELIAQRLVRFGGLVGAENVLAATDCGFGTFAGYDSVHPDIAWAKLAAMAEGARLATRQLRGVGTGSP